MAVQIRECAPPDHFALIRMVREILAEYGFPHDQVRSLERDLRELSERGAPSGAGFWVVEEQGEIVGSVAVRPKSETTCEVKRLYLRADRRGTGLGQRLYLHAEQFARAAGYERIWLDSSQRFVKAHRLYERNGFVLLEQVDNEWEDSIYEKALV